MIASRVGANYHGSGDSTLRVLRRTPPAVVIEGLVYPGRVLVILVLAWLEHVSGECCSKLISKQANASRSRTLISFCLSFFVFLPGYIHNITPSIEVSVGWSRLFYMV